MELRHPESDSDWDQTFEVLRRAFNLTVERERWQPNQPAEMLWQLYDGAQLLATSRNNDWGQWFGGRRVRTAAIAGVAVAPQHRGRGYASELFRRTLLAWRDQGFAQSGLMPATTGLYRGVGYEVSAVWSDRTIATRALRDLPRASHVQVRVATVEDLPKMRECMQRVTRTRDGWLDMADQWWSWWSTTYDEGFGFAAVHGDDVLGYVWYRHVPDPAWGFGISTEGVVADDVDVYCALWQTLASSSSMVHSLKVRNLPPENPLLLMLPEQDLVPGLELRYMSRLLDVPSAVAARGYPAGLDVTVDVAVEDPIIDANAGRWRLQVRDGVGSAEPGGDGAIELDVGALSSIFTGWATPETMRLAGRLRGGGDDDVAALRAMFAGPTPSLQLFF